MLLEGAGCGGKGAVNFGRRPGWLPGWVRGSEIPSPGAGRSGKAAAESRLGLGALQGPSLLLDPSPLPIRCQDPPLHRRQVLLDFSQKSRKKRTAGTGSEGEGKVEKHSSTSLFYLSKDGATEAREGGAESQGRTPSQYFKFGAALTARFSSQRSLITSRLSFPAGQLENTKEFIKK